MINKEILIGSIFCGAGGMDTGLSKLNFKTVWAMDIMKEACESFKANYPETQVINIDVHTIKDFSVFGKINGLVFGPPCQGFSVANKNRHDRFEADKRNFAYLATLKALKDTKAEFFIFENVKGLLDLKYDNGVTAFSKIVKDYQSCGYNLYHKVIDCAAVGVPQLNRYRLIIVGIRKDIDFKYVFEKEEYGPKEKHPYVTLRDTIWHLKDIDQTDYTHFGGFSSQFLGRNRQKEWDETSFTIEASARHAKIHPDGGRMWRRGKDDWVIPSTCRRFSTIESALIQTFPEEYTFCGSLESIYMQIGNAVPPLLAMHIGRGLLPMYEN